MGDSFTYGCLRSLSAADASGMLEWMHDKSIANVFNANFLDLNADDVSAFIERSWKNETSLHFAIAGADGEYLGTVSLKDVDTVNRSAEYAISTRKAAQGTGAAMQGTRDVLAYAFDELGLERVYLNVKSTNQRAIHFYRKVGFVEEGTARHALRLPDGSFVDLLWFSMLREDS